MSSTGGRTSTTPTTCDPLITYSHVDAFQGWGRAPSLIARLIDRFGARDILEVGAGANPTLDDAVVRAHDLRYTLNDVSAAELEKGQGQYRTLCHDFSSAVVPQALVGQFDFIFSRMVNEHVRNAELYHRNLLELLRDGGIAVHMFATLYTLPFCLNRILPNSISGYILRIVAPRDQFFHGKFRAYYRWCRGPTASMIGQYERLGYEVLEYAGYFGHGYYDARVPLLARLERRKTDVLLRHPVPQLTSYAKVVLRKQ